MAKKKAKQKPVVSAKAPKETVESNPDHNEGWDSREEQELVNDTSTSEEDRKRDEENKKKSEQKKQENLEAANEAQTTTPAEAVEHARDLGEKK